MSQLIGGKFGLRFLIAFSCASLFTFGLPNPAASVRLSGKVVNGSRDDAPVPGQTVKLHVYLDRQEIEDRLTVTETDAKGRFIFTGLDTSKGYVFSSSTVYLSVEYFEERQPFIGRGPQMMSTITVYDTTSTASDIRVKMHHVIVKPAKGTMEVREILLLRNEGRKTYIGQEEIASDSRTTLKFAIPANAEQLELGGDLMSCCTYYSDGNIYDTMEFSPGDKQVVYSYQLPIRRKERAIEKVFIYDTDLFDIFIPKSGVVFKSAGMVRIGDFFLRNIPYIRYEAQNIPKGQVVPLEFADLSPETNIYRWLILIGGGLAIAFTLLFTFRQRGKGKTPSQSTQTEEALSGKGYQELIQKLAELDNEYEKGRINPGRYQKERQRLKDKVLQILQSKKGGQKPPPSGN